MLFGGFRSRRRAQAELGTGIWRQSHDRFVRGLDRYHQVLESADEAITPDLVEIADSLSALLPRVRALCASGQRLAPSDGQDVPGGALNELHRGLSRAGNALATAAQAAAMASLAGSDTASVRRRSLQVIEEIERAEALPLAS